MSQKSSLILVYKFLVSLKCFIYILQKNRLRVMVKLTNYQVFIKNVKIANQSPARSNHQKVFLRKGVLKIFSKFRAEHPCRSAVSIKLLFNFIEIPLRHGSSPVNLLHIFRKTFLKNFSLDGCFCPAQNPLLNAKHQTPIELTAVEIKLK